MHRLAKEAGIRMFMQVLDGNELEVSALSEVHYDLIHIADSGKCPGYRTHWIGPQSAIKPILVPILHIFRQFAHHI